jgi:hypothetical protein
MESPWEGLVGGFVLGDREYARELLAGRKVDVEEQTEARRLRRRVEWDQVVKAAERLKKGPWEQWAESHGDWGRDGSMYVAVRHGGLRLAEVVQAQGGIKYQAAAQAVKRFQASLAKEPERRRYVERLRRQLSNI